jgi:hypothetical protein
MRAVALAAVAVAFSHGPAWSCTIIMPTLAERIGEALRDRPAVQAPDCSFQYGGNRDEVAGGPAVDLGHGRIAQDQYWISGVTTGQRELESTFLVDCSTGETAEVYGWLEAETNCGSEYSMEGVVAPDGPLDLRHGPNLSALVERAESLEIWAQLDAIRISDDLRSRNSVDFFCGCRLFYPDSPGARQ